MSGLVFTLDGGDLFEARERHVPEVPPFGAFGNDEDKLTAWVMEKWNILFELKRGEAERLKTCELFYAGFHYIDPQANRENAITNYCSSTVETVWPLLTQERPRPEPVPRRYMDDEKIAALRMYATYKMDSTGFDRIYRIAQRDILKYGWCPVLISWDADGRSIPKWLDPFDFYPDQAVDESGLDCFAIAFPVATRRLQACYPDKADRIKPDNIASPSYEVRVRPYNDAAGMLGGLSNPNLISTLGPSIATEGVPATTTSEYSIDTGQTNVFGQTTFVIQLFVRDYSKMTVKYTGTRFTDHETGTLANPHSLTQEEPCCPSGWRMIPMTATGVLLAPPLPVDECLGGIPLVIGRDYEIGGRFYGKGELDDIIPLQRAVNRTDAQLDRALELQSDPVVIVTKDSGLRADKSAVLGGEILTVRHGAKVDYMNPPSVAESHFVRRAGRRQDIQIVAGTPDSLQGQRPVGVEAAAAIRQLSEQGASRARAKGAGALEWAALLVDKMIKCDIRKSKEFIYFVDNSGKDAWLNPADYNPDDFEIRWAQASGDAQSQQDRRDRNLQYYQLGLIDGQQVLEDDDFPGRDRIMQRMAVRQQAQALMAASQNGGASKNGGKK